MATGNEEWVSALERMQTLGDISNTVKNKTDTFSAAQKALTKKVDDMKVQIAKIRQIMVVKTAAGKTATESCKRAVIKAEGEQKTTIQKINTNIDKITDMTALEQAINALETDINALAGGPGAGAPAKPAASRGGPGTGAGAGDNTGSTSARGLNPAAKEFVPGQKGGYTYGKSRKKGKGRRKRTKKSRKKRSKKH